MPARPEAHELSVLLFAGDCGIAGRHRLAPVDCPRRIRAAAPAARLTVRWTVKRFAELEHVVVAPLGLSQRSVIEPLLARRRLSRRVTRVVTSFLLALPLVLHSDRVAILPRSTANASARLWGLEFRPVPVAMPAVEMCLAWYLGSEAAPQHVWTRRLMHDVVRAVGLGA